jgi:hypothetical protein
MKNMNARENTVKDLLERVDALKTLLARKNEELIHTRVKLARAKKDVDRLKDIVTYQRDRIVQLHSHDSGNESIKLTA